MSKEKQLLIEAALLEAADLLNKVAKLELQDSIEKFGYRVIGTPGNKDMVRNVKIVKMVDDIIEMVQNTRKGS
jgi:hypothetical protein